MSEDITNLEVKVAFLEKTVLEYSDLFQELYKKIDWLESELKRIEDEQRQSNEVYSAQEEKPPHY